MVILLQQKNFGPNVIYFALGITEGRPAGAALVIGRLSLSGVLEPSIKGPRYRAAPYHPVRCLQVAKCLKVARVPKPDRKII